MSVLSRFDRHARMMDRMADALGLDLAEATLYGELAPSELREAVFRCTGCTQPGACAEWVEAHPDGATSAPDYCRNKDRFARMPRR